MADFLLKIAEVDAQIERRAHERGFDTVEAYLLALIDADTAEDDEVIDIRAEFIEAWREAKRGEGLPTEEFLHELEEDNR